MLRQTLGNIKYILKDVINKLKGSDKRVVLAKIAQEIGIGGQSVVAKEFQVGRDTVRKGMNELRTGIACEDAFGMRGRKKITEHLPNLQKDICEILEPGSQTDPTFKSLRQYTRISVSFIIKELKKRGYTDDELPCTQTIANILNDMDYIINCEKYSKQSL